jgi:hypothetical protein
MAKNSLISLFLLSPLFLDTLSIKIISGSDVCLFTLAEDDVTNPAPRLPSTSPSHSLSIMEKRAMIYARKRKREEDEKVKKEEEKNPKNSRSENVEREKKREEEGETINEKESEEGRAEIGVGKEVVSLESVKGEGKEDGEQDGKADSRAEEDEREE